MKNSINPLHSVPSAVLAGSMIIAVAILLSGGIIRIGPPKSANTQAQVIQQPSAQPAQQQPTEKLASLDEVKAVFSKSAIKFGDTGNRLIIIEVADPSCPYCHIAAGRNPELNKQAGSRFTLVSDGGTYVAPVPEFQKLVSSNQASYAFIYSPGHGNGEMGTKAMYCAFEKGKFWEVHDRLMTSESYDLLNNTVKNDKTEAQALADFLKPVFDPAVMKQCLDSGKYETQLKTDVSLASNLGISGTPGYYLNATAFRGAYSYSEMESSVKAALGEK